MRPILWPFLMPLQICHIRLEHPRQKPVCKTVANDAGQQFGEWRSVSGHLSRLLPAQMRLMVFVHSTFVHLPLLPCSRAVMTAERYTTFISQLMSESKCLIEKNYSSAAVTNCFLQEYSNKRVICEQMFTNFVVGVAGNGFVTCRPATSAHSYIGMRLCFHSSNSFGSSGGQLSWRLWEESLKVEGFLTWQPHRLKLCFSEHNRM